MSLAAVGVVLSLVKAVVGNSLVDKMISNWTKGTHNKIDDWVWKAIKAVAGLDLPENDKIEKVQAALEDVQTRYNLLSENEKTEAKKTIVMADLGPLNQEIGVA